MNNRKLTNEIAKYLAGECSSPDIERISGLLQADEAYKQAFTELKSIWEIPGVLPVTDDYNTNIAWEKVSARTSGQQVHIAHKPERQSAFLPWLRYASIAAVLVLSLSIFFVYRPYVSMKTVASGPSGISPVALSDGSLISLNHDSKLKFTEKFGNHSREVYFWGEAFFEIAPDPSRPFVIETGDTRIKVVGTSFNVRNSAGGEIIEVVVNTGKVLFYRVDKNDRTVDQVMLVKGDKGIYNSKSHTLSRMVNDDVNYNSWKSGVLVFNETSLDKVLQTVGRKYNVTFHLADTKLENLKLTATFDNESLDSVLEVLRLIHKLQFSHKGTDYLVVKTAG